MEVEVAEPIKKVFSQSQSSLQNIPAAPPPKSQSMENPDQNQNLEKVSPVSTEVVGLTQGDNEETPKSSEDPSQQPLQPGSGKNPAIEVCPWDHE